MIPPYLKHGLIAILIMLIACDDSPDDNPIGSEMEQLIMNKWDMESVEMNGAAAPFVTWGFNPQVGTLSQRPTNPVSSFWFSYNSDMTYELRNDWRTMSYGEEDNYQPEYGNWQLDEDANLLIHNKGLRYEKVYRVLELTDTSFIREFHRTIYDSGDTTLWPIGETVICREVFKIRE